MARVFHRLITAGAVAVAATLAAGGCSSAASSSRPEATTAPSSVVPHPSTSVPGAVVTPADWVPCRGDAGPAGYQCATVSVPRDPQDPAAHGTIGLAIDRHPATGTRIGSLLVNPGGPGGSGVDFLPEIVGLLGADVLEHFDIVGFDPPGVDRSAPIICLPGPELDRYYGADPDPTTAQGMAAYIAVDQQFAAGCEARSGAELPYVSTVDAAMDMDIIRADIGDPSLNYLGFSYGTFLGATYAELFPTRIRAMVLDGALDPALPVVTSLDQQSAAFDADLDAALSACGQSPSCPWKYHGNPISAFEALMAAVTAHPLTVAGSSQSVGPAAFLYGTALTLYDTSYWNDLYEALAGVTDGNGTDMLQLFDDYVGRNANGTYSNELEANVAVNCLDAPAPPVATIEADLPAAERQAPVFGAADLLSEIQCDYWPVAATGRVGPIHADGSPPIVVVGSTGDPATPYQDAVALAAQLQHGVLLTRVGEGHTGYPYSSCIRSHVDDYLVHLTVPAAGIRCPTD